MQNLLRLLRNPINYLYSYVILRICIEIRSVFHDYCGTGYRGNIAADELNKEGFDAITLDGGFGSWNQS